MNSTIRFLSLVCASLRYGAAWAFSLVIPALCCIALPVLGPQRIWLWFARPWARATLAILGIRPRLTGEPLLGPAVFIANHQSLLDVVLLPALLPPGTRFVARRNLRLVPFWGWIFIRGGAIPIERRSAGGGDVARLRRGLDALPDGWSVMVFPEGTRRREPEPARFRRGALICAAHLQVPVVPIGIAGLEAVASPNNFFLRRGDVHVHVGPRFYVADASSEAVGAATQRAYGAVLESMREARAQQVKAVEPVACVAPRSETRRSSQSTAQPQIEHL